VYYLSYPCQKLNAWWVVYTVNPHEWLHTPRDAGYQEEELPPSFVVDPGAGLNDLVGDADDIEMPVIVKQKWKPTKKKVQLPRLRIRLPNRDADEF
jgi:hypothetical protein